jgi:hypothetical protein
VRLLNFRWAVRCEGRKRGVACEVGVRSGTIKHTMQEDGPGVGPRLSGAKYQGDWRCKCKGWNREFHKVCGRCAGKKEDCLVGEDHDDSLESYANRHATVSSTDRYWNGGPRHPEAYNASSAARAQRASQAAYLGVLGQSKESKDLSKRW